MYSVLEFGLRVCRRRVPAVPPPLGRSAPAFCEPTSCVIVESTRALRGYLWAALVDLERASIDGEQNWN
jgi:hypothetical protein